MANVTNQTRSAYTWREYTAATGTNGRTIMSGTNDLKLIRDEGKVTERTIYPVLMIVESAGLVILTDYAGTTRAISALAGVPYPVQPAGLVTTATTADNICFYYNAP